MLVSPKMPTCGVRAPLALGAVLLGGSAEALAEPGDVYLKATARTLVGDAAFGPDGDTLDLPKGFQDHQLRIWGSHDLDERWTVFGQVTPIGLGVYDDEGETYFGGGAVGAGYHLVRGPFTLTVEAEGGARPGSPTLFSGFAEGVPVRVTPVVGTAHFGGRLVAVQGFRWGWIRAHGGARAFSNPRLDPALEAYLQAGFRPADALLIDVHLSGWYAFGDLTPVEVIGSGQTRYLGLGLGVEWWALGDIALTGSFDVGPIARANAVSPAIGLGFAFRAASPKGAQ